MKEPVKIVGTYLHAHLAGVGVSVRQFRNGQDLGVIDEDRHYDFNYQQYKEFSTPVQFQPVSFVCNNKSCKGKLYSQSHMVMPTIQCSYKLRNPSIKSLHQSDK